MATVAELQAVLDLKGDKFTAGIRKAQTETERSFGRMRSVAEGVKASFVSIQGVLAGLAVGSFLKSSVDNFLEAEQSSKNLQVAIEQTGGSFDKLREQFTAFAIERQAKTIFGDEETFDAATRWINATQDVAGAMNAVALGQDIAAGSGRSLEEVMLGLAQAQNGNARTLGSFIPSIRTLVAEEASWAEVQAALIKQFGGMAEATSDTAAGRIKRLANAWGGLKESIGGFVANGTEAVNWLTKIINKTNEWINVSRDAKVAMYQTSIDNLKSTKEPNWEERVTHLEFLRDSLLDTIDLEKKLADAQRARSVGGGGVGGGTRPGVSIEFGGRRENVGSGGIPGPAQRDRFAEHEAWLKQIIQYEEDAEAGIRFLNQVWAQEHATMIASTQQIADLMGQTFGAGWVMDTKKNIGDVAEEFGKRIAAMIADALVFASIMQGINLLLGGQGSWMGFFRGRLGVSRMPEMFSSGMPGMNSGNVVLVADGVEIARVVRRGDSHRSNKQVQEL